MSQQYLGRGMSRSCIVIRLRHLTFLPLTGFSHDGKFSIKSDYGSITAHINQSKSHIFRLIWRWKGLQQIQTFLWLTAHNALLTNAVRQRGHLTHSNQCPFVILLQQLFFIHLGTAANCIEFGFVWLNLTQELGREKDSPLPWPLLPSGTLAISMSLRIKFCSFQICS